MFCKARPYRTLSNLPVTSLRPYVLGIKELVRIWVTVNIKRHHGVRRNWLLKFICWGMKRWVIVKSVLNKCKDHLQELQLAQGWESLEIGEEEQKRKAEKERYEIKEEKLRDEKELESVSWHMREAMAAEKEAREATFKLDELESNWQRVKDIHELTVLQTHGLQPDTTQGEVRSNLHSSYQKFASLDLERGNKYSRALYSTTWRLGRFVKVRWAYKTVSVQITVWWSAAGNFPQTRSWHPHTRWWKRLQLKPMA